MKKLILIFILFASSYAITPFSYKWTVNLSGDTVTVGKLRGNYDSLLNFSTRLCDTVNGKSPWAAILRGDSLFKRINADTLRSNTDVDSLSGVKNITGAPHIDTARVNKIVTSGLDSVGGGLYVGALTRLNGVVTTNDSLYVGTMLTVTNTTKTDSLASRTIKSTGAIIGNLTGNVTGVSDSAKGANHLTGGAVSATTGLFSSTLSADSGFFTKGIKAASINSSTTLAVDSVASAKGVKCTQINAGLGNTKVPVYSTSTFACSLFASGTIDTFKTSVTATYIRTGNLTTIYFPSSSTFTSGGSAPVKLSTFPAGVGAGGQTFIMYSQGGATKLGTITISVTPGNKCTLYDVSGATVSGAGCGFPGSSTTYYSF